jgi:hypothetical protein
MRNRIGYVKKITKPFALGFISHERKYMSLRVQRLSQNSRLNKASSHRLYRRAQIPYTTLMLELASMRFWQILVQQTQVEGCACNSFGPGFLVELGCLPEVARLA